MNLSRHRPGGAAALVAAALGALGASLIPTAEADAQGCVTCPPGQTRDARGRPCCPPRVVAPLPPPIKPPTPACPDGKEINPDTAGRCCWPGQAWSGTRCVGKPTRCPDGLVVSDRDDDCTIPTCPPGKVHPPNSATACCWPGQAWSSTRSTCLGAVTSCAPGFDVSPDKSECISDDVDQDGIPNAKDRCAEIREDRDNFEDDDGCPEADNDRDGVHDNSDRCSGESEDPNGFEDDDGCPDEHRRAAAEAAAQEAAAAAAAEAERQRQAQLQAEEEERQRLARLAEEERARARDRATEPRFFDADYKYVVGGTVQYWPTFDGVSVGFDYHAGAGPMVLGISPQVGNLSFGGEPSVHLRGTLGVEVVSWPNWRGSTFSLVNLDAGAAASVNYMSGGVGTMGPYIREQVKLGPIALHLMWTHAWLSDGFEDNLIGFGIGYAGVNDGRSEAVE